MIEAGIFESVVGVVSNRGEGGGWSLPYSVVFDEGSDDECPVFRCQLFIGQCLVTVEPFPQGDSALAYSALPSCPPARPSQLLLCPARHVVPS